MVVLGLILVVAGVILGLCGIFLSQGSDASILGIDMEVRTIFVIGVVAGACAIWGFSILKYGTKREWSQRKEQRKIEELSAKLDAVKGQEDNS